MKIKIPVSMKYFELIITTIIFFPIITSLGGNSSVVNKILVAVLLFEYMLVILESGISRNSFKFISLMVLNYFFTLLHTIFPLDNLNLMFYYPFIVLFFTMNIDFKYKLNKTIMKLQGLINIILYIWSLLVGISIFLPSSYVSKGGGVKFFGSYCGTSFRLCPAAIFIMILGLTCMIYQDKKIYIYFSFIPLYCCFMGSSRTYLVVGLSIFLIQWFLYVENKKKFYLSLIPLMGSAFIVIIFSSVGDKILLTLDSTRYGDFWFRITSSRSSFWYTLLMAWSELPIINQCFGAGIGYSYETIGLWAHNDFIELLVSFGFWGLLQYLILIYSINKNFFKTKQKIPIIIKVLIVFGWMFNAFFNMFYTYFCIVLSYPILLCAVNKYYNSL